jgi:hypothetical protein
MKQSYPGSTMSVNKSNTDFSLKMSRKAPQFLDENGMAMEHDPLAETWKSLSEAFSRLHGQRLVELMTVMLGSIPKDEKVILEWEHDERSFFYLRFSNGWSLGAWTENDQPNQHRFNHQSTAMAPEWFPRDEPGIDRWKHWHNLLHCYCIDQRVDNLALERLQKLSDKLGGFSQKDLPRIQKALVGAEWGSSLEYMEIAGATAEPTAKPGPRRRI